MHNVNHEPELLKIENLSVFYSNSNKFIRAVDGASISLKERQIATIVGESGSGKTQLALAILGLNYGNPGIVKGRIRFQGKELLSGIEKYCKIDETEGNIYIQKDMRGWTRLHRKRMKSFLGNKISIIFQEPTTSLDPYYSVGSQLIETLMCHSLAANRSAARTKAINWLKTVELEATESLLKSFPHQLSGGMSQRVMIALALCSNPNLLIADEPTTALDAPIQFEILRLLKQLNRDLGVTILFITHDLGIVKHFADYVFVMLNGKIIDEGCTEDVFTGDRDRFHPFTQKLLNAGY